MPLFSHVTKPAWHFVCGPTCIKAHVSLTQALAGLQDETAYSQSNQILYRQCIYSLHQKAARQRQKRVYLTGPRGCGKSIALASLVDWARSQGWLVSPNHVQEHQIRHKTLESIKKYSVYTKYESSFAKLTRLQDNVAMIGTREWFCWLWQRLRKNSPC